MFVRAKPSGVKVRGNILCKSSNIYRYKENTVRAPVYPSPRSILLSRRERTIKGGHRTQVPRLSISADAAGNRGASGAMNEALFNTPPPRPAPGHTPDI